MSKLHILSMDGGGIFGLFTALMIKDIVEQKPDFLSSKHSYLFAGTSAGAINALLLAKYENPTTGIDDMLAFWKEPDVYNNSDPLQCWLSGLGWAAWYGTQDMLSVLNRYFGKRKLGELHHKVLITTWSWRGSEKFPPELRYWRPKLFYNFPDDEADREVRITEAAFAAGAPGNLRIIFQGRQDGGWVAPNPSMCAVVKAVKELASDKIDSKDWNSPLEMLEEMMVLSLGVGLKEPFLPVSYADWGTFQWSTGMYNPWLNLWLNPMDYINFNAPTDMVNTQCKYLLGQEAFFRLNPKVISPPSPLITTLVLLRNNPAMLSHMINVIEDAAKTAETKDHIEKAIQWLDKAHWFDFDKGA